MQKLNRGYTLIEMILVVVISAILAIGTFKALQAIYLRSAKARTLTELSLSSQIALDQISAMLYNRVPGTTIGYSPDGGICEGIDELTATRPVLEWIGKAEDENIWRYYDSFIDIDTSGSIDFDANSTLSSELNTSQLNLFFAGALEYGEESGAKVCAGAYGWHGKDSNKSYDFTVPQDNKIHITDAVTPKFIYEKYYFGNGAYAVSRMADIDKSASCIDNNITGEDDNNTLLLFYDYRPWKSETFCADPVNAGSRTGSVTVLSRDVASFEAYLANGSVHLGIDMNRSVNGGGIVQISKRKVAF